MSWEGIELLYVSNIVNIITLYWIHTVQGGTLSLNFSFTIKMTDSMWLSVDWKMLRNIYKDVSTSCFESYGQVYKNIMFTDLLFLKTVLG